MQKIMHLGLQVLRNGKKIVVKRLARGDVSLANRSDAESKLQERIMTAAMEDGQWFIPST